MVLRGILRAWPTIKQATQHGQSSLLLRKCAALSPGTKVPQYGRMLSQQYSLPRLPVPPLQQTLERYLGVVRPLLNDDEYKHAQQLVEEFRRPGGSGEKLQTLLENRANNTINWLEEWWLNVAYLEYRLPVPIHVSPGISLPPLKFSGQQDQLRCAARLVAAVMDYKVMIDKQTLPVEYMGKSPLCMDQFFKILSSCRVPGPKRDSLTNFPPYEPNPPKHIAVVHNNHYFSVEVYSYDGLPLTEDQIYEQLCELVNKSEKPAPQIGLLTANGRNSWSKVYSKLIKDPTNRASAMSIQRSIFMLCLDQPISHDPDTCRNTIVANQMNHGGGSKFNSSNRWFDKTLQFIVGADGAIGANYEHSVAEGPPIISLIDYAMTHMKKDQPKRTPVMGTRPLLPLPFNVTSEIEDAIEEAKDSFDSCINDLDLLAYKFTNYGKDFPKSQKMSPDAFLQVAYQLAYHRIYGKNPPTYESGSLRQFQHGRTETIRSATIESDRYCKAMLDNNISSAEKAKLLREAVEAHKRYTNWAISGNGVDRHLLGLKLIAIENGLDVPPFFMDSIYAESQHFRLSTSQVASKHDALLGFGPVVPDGYGLCYNPMESHINFCISSWKSCPETDSNKFSRSLQQSLEDAQNILLQTSAKL